MKNFIWIVIAILFYTALGYGSACLCACFMSHIWLTPIFYVFAVVCSITWFFGAIVLGSCLEDQRLKKDRNEYEAQDY